MAHLHFPALYLRVTDPCQQPQPYCVDFLPAQAQHYGLAVSSEILVYAASIYSAIS